ncbi:MAG TPA: SET domain-containing protein-lysine N-methyltransferase [Chromatiaceae bacterium]|nr:MAG: SET domain-containing protein-lysine N-methyltransferase [Thiohalocapsa sp. PB-PSB1]HBG96359.1 SET domain-containing protein-lysine N-methyltransferase [Chromatiaceae bacterium]HCS90736.1 SET domain-containing protein-lysine N-methyltransferase [Chromatiaceae bacterium]
MTAPDNKPNIGRLRERVAKGPSSLHGQGCFARVAFRAGDFIGTYQGREARRDGTYVLWISSDGKHWIGRSGRNLLRWLNHSNRPNAVFDGFDLYALTDIGIGEEITFDYTAGADHQR